MARDACVLCEGLRSVVDVGEDLCRCSFEVVGDGADLDIRRRWCGGDKGGRGAATSVPRVGDTVDGWHIGEAIVERRWSRGNGSGDMREVVERYKSWWRVAWWLVR